MSHDPPTLQEISTQLGGLRFFYRASAIPAPEGAAIVHVHGFGISGTYVTPTAAARPFFRTYVPDLPGFGRSASGASAGHPLADAVARFMDHVA
jgi:pimeloyl-ACP methyl ester carboxylesterase